MRLQAIAEPRNVAIGDEIIFAALCTLHKERYSYGTSGVVCVVMWNGWEPNMKEES
jgi:hypothetical protein